MLVLLFTYFCDITVGYKPRESQVYTGERRSEWVQSTSTDTRVGSTYQAHVWWILTAAVGRCYLQLCCLLRRDSYTWRATWWQCKTLYSWWSPVVDCWPFCVCYRVQISLSVLSATCRIANNVNCGIIIWNRNIALPETVSSANHFIRHKV